MSQIKVRGKMSFAEAANVTVSSVTANGDALVNGGTTNITAGDNYAIKSNGTTIATLKAVQVSDSGGFDLGFFVQSVSRVSHVSRLFCLTFAFFC